MSFSDGGRIRNGRWDACGNEYVQLAGPWRRVAVPCVVT